MVIENASGNFFVPVRDGIYYYAHTRELCFYSFAAKSRKVLLIPSHPIQLGLSVSPDGHWLIYTSVDGQPGSDLMMVDDFR